jgi:hypothetical protein
MAKLKKGSAAAKAFMAKIRAAKGKTKVVKAKAKTKVGMDATANDIKVTSNVKNRTFTIKKNGTTYRTGKFSKPEFKELEYNTQNDWANFLRTQDNYSKVKTGAVKKVMPTKKATSMHKDTKSHNVNIRVLSGIDAIDFTRVNNDINGNPRYVIHFLDILNPEERMTLPFAKKYEYALKKGKLLGGKKYDNKQYGGGIVYQSYNIQNLEKKLLELKHTTPKIKY